MRDFFVNSRSFLFFALLSSILSPKELLEASSNRSNSAGQEALFSSKEQDLQEIATVDFTLVRSTYDKELSRVNNRSSALEKAYAPYLEREVHLRGFILRYDAREALSQTPRIQTCCQHQPKVADLIWIRWKGATTPQELVEGDIDDLVGRLRIELDHVYLEEARRIEPTNTPLYWIWRHWNQLWS